MNRDIAGLIGLFAAGVLAVLALWLWQSGDANDEVLAELTEGADTTTSTAEIEPPQPDATAESPAVTTDAVRAEADRETPVTLGFTIVEELTHDTGAYTQGFEISDGQLFESTGRVGQSSIRELDLATGAVLRTTDVADVFAEGLTIIDDTAIQITWRDGVAYRRNLDTFDVIETFSYEGEGWGICDLGTTLAMSDGTSELDFRDPVTFEVLSTVEVAFGGTPINMINELECVNGSVWANIWQSSLIIEIDPASGEVVGVLDAAPLTPLGFEDNSSAVLNGIAYDPSDGTFLLTGKLWPTIYRVQIQPAAQ